MLTLPLHLIEIRLRYTTAMMEMSRDGEGYDV